MLTCVGCCSGSPRAGAAAEWAAGSGATGSHRPLRASLCPPAGRLKVQRLADGQVYALKVADCSKLTKQDQQSMLDEIRLLSGIRYHPNLVSTTAPRPCCPAPAGHLPAENSIDCGDSGPHLMVASCPPGPKRSSTWRHLQTAASSTWSSSWPATASRACLSEQEQGAREAAGSEHS